MKSGLSSSLDAYLQELVNDGRKSGKLKLVAIWDGLSIENQIKILNSVGNMPHKLKLKALSSQNDYVRYLAASRFCSMRGQENLDFEEKELFEKISSDKNIIVRSTQCPSQKIYIIEKGKSLYGTSVLKPENFFLMKEEEQIMYFSKLSIREGNDIAKIIEWGLNNGVEQSLLDDLIFECAANFEKFEPFIYDYSGSKGIETLWKLVPKLGITQSARLLVWSLPSGINANDKIPDKVLDSLSEEILIELLQWRNIFLSDFRRMIVFSEDEKYNRKVKVAAASINLDITDEDITNIINGNNYDVLSIIVECCMSNEYGICWYPLSPVYTHVLLDHCNDSRDKKHGKTNLDGNGFERYFDVLTRFDKSDKEKYDSIKCELSKLAVYELARSAIWQEKNSADWDDYLKYDIFENIPRELRFLKSKVVSNNAWETYKAFRKALRELREYEPQLLSLDYIRCKFSSIVPLPPEDIEEVAENFSTNDEVVFLYKEVRKIVSTIDHLKDSLIKVKYGMFILVGWVVIAVIIQYF